MFHQTRIKTATVAGILLAGFIYALAAGHYGRELIIEAAILAILAISLDLAAGYGGMVSLCHGAMLGIGAYAYASLTTMLGAPPIVAMLAGIAAAGLFGLFIGAVTSRTRGIYFIMATLAFGQMVYVFVFESPYFGGDDGLAGLPRLDLSAIGVNLNLSASFAMFTLVLLGCTYAAAAALLRSGFGRTLVGIRVNEDRMRALGLPARRYKTAAFGFSGALAGLAGTLAAQHTMFVSPEILVWTVSGEALVIVILGGLGTLAGPVIGAALLVFLKHELTGITVYWHLVIGLVLILTVMAGGRGIYGLIEHRLATRRRPSPTRATAPALEEAKSHA
jgi:branched-chain amino acid transport system permease protein